MAITEVYQEIDLSETILRMFINNQVSMNIHSLKQTLKRYRTPYNNRALAYSDLELGVTLDNLVQRWTTFMGKQYRLRISVWRSGFSGHEIRFTLLSRDIPSQEEECPSSPSEGIRADGMMDMVT